MGRGQAGLRLGGLKLVGTWSSSNHTADLAQRTMRAMVKHYVPAMPENYHVWFHHVAGDDEALSNAIDEHIRTKGKFTDDVCADLFRKHVLTKYASDHLRTVQEDIKSVLREALTSVATAGTATGEFSGTLEQSVGQLESATDLNAVRGVVQTLAKQSVAMAETARGIQTELQAATEQVQALQRQLEETEEAALIDPLTGLYNRAGLDRRLAELERGFQKSKQPFSVVVADIDHFKKFNDTYGHPVGDAVLRLVGKVMKDTLKGRDFIARHGGEEFIALLPETRRDGASVVAQNIRQSIENQRLRVVKTEQEIPRITMSFGVAEFSDRDTRDTVVDRADQALYLAKRSGRNTVKTEIELPKSA